ncbi:MAG: RNA polymerase sigma factor [Clostridia bacterium]|nr:RNA polymerase sigma factor [Clostridia bacterium]
MTKDDFSAAIVKMQPVLYRVSYSVLLNAEDCADAVQECILKAWSARDRLRREEYMQTWVIRILLNVCYDMRRRRRPTVDIDSMPEPVAPRDANRELHDAIAALEERLRVAVVLHYMEGYSVEEIAKLLRCPAGTVKSRLKRARQQLKRELTIEGGLCDAKG